MADQDSWWKDTTKNSDDSNSNPFTPRTTQNDGSSFAPRSLQEGFDPRIEIAEKGGNKRP
ncbi:hypothetical protein [Niallia taxi]|uniref:hypothetical protein n=1 Tax=Niallia taxi TaxID=2499688 RepID=UPI0015F3AB09|nr:hypothetical protein [Niallia taxi]